MRDCGTGAAAAAIRNGGRMGLFGLLAVGMGASPAYAAGTLAGTNIDNVATATFGDPGSETTISSNIVSLRVDELLDLSIASADPGDVPTRPGATGEVLRFTLTNAGNGSEAFGLSTVSALGGDDFDPNVTSIVLDSNGNGAYDAGVDTAYVAGSNDPVLAPDGSISVFVLSTIPAGAANAARGRVQLAAVARTGTGDPGTSFAGAGQGGGDAIVGATRAAGDASGVYAVSAATLALSKSALVADPFGGSAQVPGATITYTLRASATGSGSVPNVRVSDAVPGGTSYTAGSIRLDGSALSDAADADAGTFGANAIAVSLGSVAAGDERVITFQVRIDDQ
jgi:uncharacterized repeat protein (TIGR01451 family)